jgi:hypothetical protein
MLKTYGTNEVKEETIVETPVIENKPSEVVNDKEYTPDSKTLLELIAGFVEWFIKLFSK